jgi:hypothetical protein
MRVCITLDPREMRATMPRPRAIRSRRCATWCIFTPSSTESEVEDLVAFLESLTETGNVK